MTQKPERRPPNAPPLLLDDAGQASIATAVMMSHHGFRRDLARFAAALATLAQGQAERRDAVADEWRHFRNTLHGHHQAEDAGVFPSLTGQHASVRATVERLTADHRQIDPLIARGDQAFADLAHQLEAAGQVVSELRALLEPHLATEEAELIPHMRGWKAFPPPPTPAEAEMIAQGFAWASHGIAPTVLERVNAMLPADLMARLPGARAAFEQRWQRTWGLVAVGASLTPIPDR